MEIDEIDYNGGVNCTDISVDILDSWTREKNINDGIESAVDDRCSKRNKDVAKIRVWYAE